MPPEGYRRPPDQFMGYSEREYKELVACGNLKSLVRELNHEEVLIATEYIKKLIESRP
jgi:hypothetical protein